MKYLCFGYLDVKAWETKSDSERNAMIDACCAYDDELKRNGNWAGGEGLQGPETATMLRYRDGKVAVTDGPFVEAKEVLGGYWMLQAKSKQEVVEWMKRCPAEDGDTIEIRQVFELSDFPIQVQEAASRGRDGD